MTIISYTKSSPYYGTPQFSNRIDTWAGIDIPYDPTDRKFVVSEKYSENPMLLSQDQYGSPELYWVFSIRNINVLRDPIFDLRPGITIYIPTLKRLNGLGISI